MKRKFFSGSSLDQAVMMAARHYELEPSELAYRQIEKKHGFLRTRKAVMITVDPENPRKQPEAAAGAAESEMPPPAPSAPPATAEDTEPDPWEGASGWNDDGPDDAAEPQAWAADSSDEPETSAPDQPEEHGGAQAWTADEPAEAEEPRARAAEEPTAVAAPGQPAETPAPGVREPARDEAAARDRRPAYRESKPRDVSGDDELLDAAVRSSKTLLKFAGIDASATATAAGERIEVEIEGPDESILVVEGGKGLLSIQHLLPRMLRGMTGRSSFVRVDSEGFHQKRKERLEALAFKEADAASRNRRPRTLPPMAPDERRIVHLALKDSPSVVTESRGTGLHKRVVIRPADGFDEPGDIEARHGF